MSLTCKREKVLMLASVASMIDQFNMQNIQILLEMGYEVHVACNFKQGNTCDARRISKLKKRLCSLRVIIHQWDCPRDAYLFRECMIAYRQLIALFERHQFLYVHCHSPVGGVLARLVAHRKGISSIYTAHGFHFYKGAPLKNWLLYYPLEKFLSRWTDGLITVNQEDEQLARRRLHAGKVFCVPGVGVDVVDTGDISREDFRRKYGIPSEAVILLSVGELSKRKNHQLILSMLPKLSRQDVYYMICGQGALREALLLKARQVGVAERIRILGFQENVRDFYQNADIFVFPSIQEGLPVALMEAMASALPCVVSDIRGNRELIDTGCFSLKQTEKLLELLERLIRNERLRRKWGKLNQAMIKNYGKDTVNQRMKKIYRACGMGCQEKADSGKTPEISVVMAAYQVGSRQVLVSAIRSILKQTYKDWELLICDDGSTDGTWELLKEMKRLDRRIRLFRNVKNHGAAYARNVCIQYARGRYIAIMDADDISVQNRLEKQRAYLDSHTDAAFVGSRGKFFKRKADDDDELYWYCKSPKNQDFLFSLPYVHASMMFRREALMKVHGYDTSRRVLRVEDYDLMLRLCAEGLYGDNLEDVLYYIRRDKKQYQRRKYKYRFHEAYVKYRGFHKLGLLPEKFFYVGKPLLVGLLPVRFTAFLQKYYYRKV